MSIENGLSPEEMGLDLNSEKDISDVSDIDSKIERVSANREQASAGQELVDYFNKRLNEVSQELKELYSEKLKLESLAGSEDKIKQINQKIDDLRAYEIFAKKKIKDGEERRDKFDALSKAGMTSEVEADLYKNALLDRATIDIDIVDNRELARPETKLDKIATDLKRAAAVLTIFVALGPSSAEAQQRDKLHPIESLNFTEQVKAFIPAGISDSAKFANHLSEQGKDFREIRVQWELLQDLERDFLRFKMRANFLDNNIKTAQTLLSQSKGTGGWETSLKMAVGSVIKDVSEFKRGYKTITRRFEQIDERIINISEMRNTVNEKYKKCEDDVKNLNEFFRNTDLFPPIDAK